MADKRPSYEEWLRLYGLKETPDYDVRSAYNAGLNPDERGHLDDRYKLPSHITYSEDSLSSKEKGAPPPGKWIGSDKDGWTFYASPTNISNAGGAKALMDFFKKNEKGVRLVLPHGYADGGFIVDDGSIARQRKFI